MSRMCLDRAFFRVGHSRCRRCSSSHSSAGTSGRTHWPAPPDVIDNYIDWLRPRLHGLDDPRCPSLVGVLIVNTNLPVPSAWSRRRIEVQLGEP